MSGGGFAPGVYARALGVYEAVGEADGPILALDYSDKVSGNPGTFHGGALAAFVETVALAASGNGALQVLSTSIEYLRGAGEQTLYGKAHVVRAGRRLANLRVEAWQESPEKPVVVALVTLTAAA